jgi:hypothetical protein
MLHVFSKNLVKLTAQKPKMTINLGQREYITSQIHSLRMVVIITVHTYNI